MGKANQLMCVVLSVILMGLTACEKNEEDDFGVIYDFYPVEFVFEIIGQDGQNLLNGCSAEFYESFSVIYSGETYFPNLGNIEGTRMYMPFFYGLSYVEGNQGDCYLAFGEFDGGRCEENLVFRMPDGEEHDIYINRTCSVDYKKGEVSVDQVVKVDGKVMDEYTDGISTIKLQFPYLQK